MKRPAPPPGLSGDAQRERKVQAITASAMALCDMADADHTVTGATVALPDGSFLYMSVEDALGILGALPAAGTA